MPIWDINALDYGFSTDPNLSAASTGPQRIFAGAMEDMEFAVATPALQTDGSSATTGNLTVEFKFYQSDGNTVVDDNSFPAYAVNATVNGATVGVLKTFRVALPESADRVAVTLTPTGNAGRVTAGWALGGHRKNRAG